jgi:hypothetical protein
MDAIQRMVRFAVPSPARRTSRIWRLLLSLAVAVLFLGATSRAVRARTVCSPPIPSATAADAGAVITTQAAARDSTAGGALAGSTDCPAGTASEVVTASTPSTPPPASSPAPRASSPAPSASPPAPPATTTPSATSTAPSGSGPTVSSSGENSGSSCSASVGSAQSSGPAGAVVAPAPSCPPGTAAAGADAGTPAVSGGTPAPAAPAGAASGSNPSSSTATGGVAGPGSPSASGPAQPPPALPAAPPSSPVVLNTIASGSLPDLRTSTGAGPVVSAGADAPRGAQSTVSVGGTPTRSTSEPSSTRAGYAPSPARTRQDLVRVRRQISVVEQQLALEAALHPRLRRLLGRIASLAEIVLSLTAPEGPRAQDRARSTVSVRSRIVKLDRLLAALERMSPSFRGRLRPTIVTLHSLFRSLLRQRATVVSSLLGHVGGRGRPTLGCGCLPARPAGARPAVLGASGATPGPGEAESRPTAGDGTLRSGADAIRRVHGARHRRQASHQTLSSATPPLVHNPAGVPGGPAGGSVVTGGSGGAVAPVTALVLTLLCALLSGLLRVGRPACRPRLLELRLERPG